MSPFLVIFKSRGPYVFQILYATSKSWHWRVQVTYCGSINIKTPLYNIQAFGWPGILAFYHPCLNLFSGACSECLHHLFVIFQVLNKAMNFESYTFRVLEDAVSALAHNLYFSGPDSNSESWHIKKETVLQYC